VAAKQDDKPKESPGACRGDVCRLGPDGVGPWLGGLWRLRRPGDGHGLMPVVSRAGSRRSSLSSRWRGSGAARWRGHTDRDAEETRDELTACRRGGQAGHMSTPVRRPV
jgi:hypothetical protein